MVFTDVDQCFADDCKQGRIDRIICLFDLLLRDYEIVRTDIGTVKLLRIRKNRCVFVFPYL